MRLTARSLIVLLLCWLLPVQGALAFARSAGMISHHARLLRIDTVRSSAERVPQLAVHHAHGQHQAQHAQTDPLLADASSVTFEKFPVKSVQHAPASCTDCGKCCLMGAAAPPPAVLQTQAVTMVIRTAKPASSDRAAYIPEKPERPPRRQSPSLT